ncbi:unnamed protein product [Echinostoma caproni]|uniref:Integrase catalytic domain-containing protein n=1 Tax=Echinostoma caproni TaxID=27848 RepID=A0A183BE26_9TREM|nr:unnamed protein product [Echinostoma caproni]
MLLSSYEVLLAMLKCKHARTTAYPAANGLVERFHKQLKAALKGHPGSEWHEALPLVLLGIRNATKADLHTTPAALALACTLRLTGAFDSPKPQRSFNYSDFAQRLAHHMREGHAATTRQQTVPVYVPKDLTRCTHVFLRVDSINTPLQALYTGPHKIIMRKDKYAIIEVNGRKKSASLGRLKPAFLETDTTSISPTKAADPPSVDATLTKPTENHPSTPPSILVKHDRRGREVRKPVRFQC